MGSRGDLDKPKIEEVDENEAKGESLKLKLKPDTIPPTWQAETRGSWTRSFLKVGEDNMGQILSYHSNH